MNTQNNTVGWRRLAAAAGALALGAAGVVSVSTAAAADVGPGQDDAPAHGSLTIHTYATDTPGTAHDGTQLSPGLDLPALDGVEFRVRNVTEANDVSVDLSTPEGWDAVAALGSITPVEDDLEFGLTDDVVETDVNGAASTGPLPIGLYYVNQTGSGDNIITDTGAVDPFLVTIPQPQGEGGWLYDVHVYPKNQLAASTATKEVDDDGAVELGQNVSWTITTPAFSAGGGSSLDELVVTDELAHQLEFVGSVQARFIAGNTETAISSDDFADYFDVDYSSSGPGGTVTIEATTAGMAHINSMPTSHRLAFTFSTAVRATGTIENNASVNFGGGVLAFPTGTATTLWGPALINKYDQANDAPLQGAEFSLYAVAENDERVLAPEYLIRENISTDIDGEALIEGLRAGSYWLVETKAPTGYVLPEGAEAWSDVFEVEPAADVADAVTIAIANAQQGVPDLPMTGANGQLLMMLAGIALVLAAGGGALAVRNRSKSAE